MDQNRRPLRGVLYDHDGTLVDSLAVVVAATNRALQAHGLPEHPATVIVPGMVHPTGVRLGLLAGVDDPQLLARLVRDFYAAAVELGPRLSTVYPRVADSLAALRRRGHLQAVVSNNSGAFVRAVLGGLGLAVHFAGLYGEEDVPAVKPDPAGLLHAAAALGLQPEDCCYVGDSGGDAEAAHAAGMQAIGVSWGIHSRRQMEDMGFSRLIDDPRELLTVIPG